MKNNRKIILSLGISFLLVLNVFAHGFLTTLPKDKLAELQKELVKSGELKVTVNFKFGTFTEETEIAYDKYQYKKSKILHDQIEASTTKIQTEVEKSGFLTWLSNLFKNFFTF